jgi:hypothetical protein
MLKNNFMNLLVLNLYPPHYITQFFGQCFSLFKNNNFGTIFRYEYRVEMIHQEAFDTSKNIVREFGEWILS